MSAPCSCCRNGCCVSPQACLQPDDTTDDPGTHWRLAMAVWLVLFAVVLAFVPNA